MRFINSLNHAFNGIVHAFKAESNMKIHFIIALLTVIASVLTYSTRYEMIALSITISFVFMAEMINTAVEAVVDLVTEKYHELAKIAKDVAAGAVLIAALNALVVAYLIFYRKLTDLSIASLDYMVNLPVHLTFAALVVVGLAVIIIKSRSVHRKGSYIHGGDAKRACGTGVFPVCIYVVGGTEYRHHIFWRDYGPNCCRESP